MTRESFQYFEQAIEDFGNQITLMTNENKAIMIANSVLNRLIMDIKEKNLKEHFEFSFKNKAIHPDIVKVFEKDLSDSVELFLDSFAYNEENLPPDFDLQKEEFEEYIKSIGTYMNTYAKLQLGFFFNDMKYIEIVNESMMKEAIGVLIAKAKLSAKIASIEASKLMVPNQSNKKLVL